MTFDALLTHHIAAGTSPTGQIRGGWKVAALAASASVSSSAVENYKSGRRVPKSDIFRALKSAFFGESDSKERHAFIAAWNAADELRKPGRPRKGDAPRKGAPEATAANLANQSQDYEVIYSAATRPVEITVGPSSLDSPNYESNLPREPVAFQKRSEMVSRVIALLKATNGRFPRTCVLWGDAGVGKSMEAADIARNASSFGARRVYWLKLRPDWADEAGWSGHISTTVEASLAAFANRVGAVAVQQERKQLAIAIRQKIGQEDHLLVLDNLAHEKELEDLDLQAPNGRVLGTSLSHEWGDVGIPVERWSPEIARRYLDDRLNAEPAVPQADQEYEFREKLSETLEYLPLALAQAASYIRMNKSTERYLALFESDPLPHLRFAHVHDSEGRKSKTVVTTVALLLDAIADGRHAEALQIAFFVTCARPEGIVYEALRYLFPGDKGELLINQGRGELTELSLLTPWEHDGPIAFHQLTHRVAADWFRHRWASLVDPNNSAPEALCQFAGAAGQRLIDACSSLAPSLRDEIMSVSDWSQNQHYSEIAETFLNALNFLPSERIQGQLRDAAGYLVQRAANMLTRMFGQPETLPRLERLNHIAIHLGEPQLQVFCKGCIASIVSSHGKLDQAQADLTYVLREFVPTNRFESLWRARMVCRLGDTLFDQQDYAGALHHATKSHEMFKEHDQLECFSALSSRCSQARALDRLGRREEAIAIYTEVADCAEQAKLPYMRAESTYQLADLLAKSGEVDRALSLHERTLREDAPLAYPPVHSTIGAIRTSIGMLRFEKGQLREAKKELLLGRYQLVVTFGKGTSVQAKQLADAALCHAYTAWAQPQSPSALRLRQLSRRMFEKAMIIACNKDDERGKASLLFYVSRAEARANIWHGLYKEAAAVACRADKMLSRLTEPSRAAGQSTLLRIQAVLGSATGQHETALKFATDLRAARQSPFALALLEQLLDDAAIVQVELRAGQISKTDAEVQLRSIITKLTASVGQEAPSTMLIKGFNAQVAMFGERAMPLIA